MTSKQRAYLKSLAMTMDPIFQIGKASLTPEVIEGIREAIDKRELVKIITGSRYLDSHSNGTSCK